MLTKANLEAKDSPGNNRNLEDVSFRDQYVPCFASPFLFLLIHIHIPPSHRLKANALKSYKKELLDPKIADLGPKNLSRTALRIVCKDTVLEVRE